MVLLESLTDKFRITLTVLSEEDFERSRFGRHICFNPPTLSTYFRRRPLVPRSLPVIFPGHRQNGAANHNSQLFIACLILIIANQRLKYSLRALKRHSRSFGSVDSFFVRGSAIVRVAFVHGLYSDA